MPSLFFTFLYLFFNGLGMFCLFEICSPGWSQTPFAAQEDWELTPPDFTTQVLGLQVTIPVLPVF